MVYAIHLYLGFRNTARRDAVASNIQAKLTAPKYGQLEVTSTTLRPGGDPALSISAFFINAPDRDTLWDEIDATFGTGVNGPVTGSRAWKHDCLHDMERGDVCVIGTERVW